MKLLLSEEERREALRRLPSVQRLLALPEVVEWIARYGRPLTLQALREELEDRRRRLAQGEEVATGPEEVLQGAEARLVAWTRPSLIPVINATGVILHTNLGRAPLSRATRLAMERVSQGYSNLEYDLERGKRGSRLVHAEDLLRRLSGAEAALAVNNNAGAVLLALSALAARRRVVIARSQLIEIGGGFRIPEIMQQSRARLVEVGTTNRVRLEDYAQALEAGASLVLYAHRSNFKIIGFTEEPSLTDLAALAHRYGVPLMADLGSGCFLNTERYGLEHEPTVQEVVAAGADVVTFSGDKLLGGPQAGLLVGRAEWIGRMKKHPLARALRADKTCLAGLNATLLHYLKDEAEREIPIWRMIALTPEQLRNTAQRWAEELGKGEVRPSHSTVGGGSLPGETLPTYVLALQPSHPARFLHALRQANPPIIARLEEEAVVFDPRTVQPEEEGALLVVLKNLTASFR